MAKKKKKRSGGDGGSLTMKSLIKPATMKRHAVTAGKALIWVGLGYFAARYLPDLVLSRVTFLREQAMKSDKHEAAVRAALGALVLGPGVVIIASKVAQGAGATKALKYVLGGVALGAAQPLLEPHFASVAQKLDEVLPTPELAAPAGYLGERAPRASVYQLPAPAGAFPAPSTTSVNVRRARIAA